MLVDIVFNVLNLLLRIGLVIFVVRKYMVHRIAQSINNEKETMNLLDEQYEQIKDSCNTIERTLKVQEQLYNEMQVKFTLWKQSVAAHKEQELQKCALQQKKIQEQIEKKQQYVQNRYIIETELPGLLLDAQQALHKNFKQDQNLGKSYITKVLSALHE